MNAAVILAGGSGERLFPYSTQHLPKQFLPLASKRSMLQETFLRLTRHFNPEHIFIITQEHFTSIVTTQIPQIRQQQIIVEPARRDTAGAITLALQQLKDAYDVVFFTPADHHVEDGEEWNRSVTSALEGTKTNRKITLLGIVPNYPETGYGYVEAKRSEADVLPVVRFHEKPDRKTAMKMVRSGKYLWNCGIFVMPIPEVLDAFETHLPDHTAFIHKKNAMKSDFLALPKVSIDYGLMEKMDDLQIVPAFFVWNDLGSWTALEKVVPQDENGNALYGDVRSGDTKGSIVFSPSQKVYLYGVQDLLVVCHDNKVLVTNKSASPDMKKWLPVLTKTS